MERGRAARARKALDGVDILLAVVRWIHAIAAVVWVGGSIFYLLVLRPSLSIPGAADSRSTLEPAVNRRFRDVVDVSILALIVTGVVITFDRLSSLPASTTYYIVLGLKLFAFLVMLLMARDLGTRGGRPWRRPKTAPVEPSISDTARTGGALRAWLSPSRVILMLGLAAFLLSMLLVHVYERTLATAV